MNLTPSVSNVDGGKIEKAFFAQENRNISNQTSNVARVSDTTSYDDFDLEQPINERTSERHDTVVEFQKPQLEKVFLKEKFVSIDKSNEEIDILLSECSTLDYHRSNITTEVISEKFVQINDIEDVVNQETNSSRASAAIKEYNLCIQATTQALFGCCTDFRELALSILYNCDLANILILRLVSRGFYFLASMINTYHPYSPLASKAAIRFPNYCLLSDIRPLTQAKLGFAQNNTQVEIEISLDDLFNGINRKLLTGFSFPENRIKSVLKLTTVDEMNQFEALLLSLSKESYLISLSQIRELNLAKIDINKATNDLISSFLMTVSENRELFSNLTTLSLGSIVFNTKFSFPRELTKLAKFSFKDVFEGARLDLSAHDFSNLEILSFGRVAKETLTFPRDLPSLKELFIKDFFGTEANRYKLPNVLPSLTILRIGYILENAIFDLSYYALPNLTTLYIGRISEKVTLILSENFPNLRTLFLGEIHQDSLFILPQSLPNLTSLSIGDIKENSNLTLPDSLPSLKKLCFGSIFSNAIVNLPILCNSLKNLVTGVIYDDSTVKKLSSFSQNSLQIIPDLKAFDEINQLKVLFENINNTIFVSRIKEIKFSTVMSSRSEESINGLLMTISQNSQLLSNLTTLSFNSILENCVLHFPESLPNLTTLSFNWLSTNAKLDLSHCFFPNLKTFSCVEIDKTSTIMLPKLLDNLKSLYINGHCASLKIHEDLKVFVIETDHDDVTREFLDTVNNRINQANTNSTLSIILEK